MTASRNERIAAMNSRMTELTKKRQDMMKHMNFYRRSILRGNPSASSYDSRADFICNGDDVEIRIPWQLLNFSDPSRMQIHDDYYDGNYGIEAVGIKEMFIGFGRERKYNRDGMP